jgi:phosphoribosyl-ATP pyrophosphohydrolase/phosphoribosyl-AMP cyclohydrolase
MWRKGETSGNVLRVRDIRLDCDGDVVLYVTDAEGPSCHTGRTSCFYRGLAASPVPGAEGDLTAVLSQDDGPPDPPAVVIARVADVIARRRRDRPEKSYVVSLMDAGWPKILGKIIEESGELVDALPEDDASHTAHEAADLIFHMLVGLEVAGVAIDDVFAQLRKRFGISGLDEKAARGAAGATPAPAPPLGKSGAQAAQKPTTKSKPKPPTAKRSTRTVAKKPAPQAKKKSLKKPAAKHAKKAGGRK